MINLKAKKYKACIKKFKILKEKKVLTITQDNRISVKKVEIHEQNWYKQLYFLVVFIIFCLLHVIFKSDSLKRLC